jgi:hypothetical protein
MQMNKHKHFKSLWLALLAMALVAVIFLPPVLAQSQNKSTTQDPAAPVEEQPIAEPTTTTIKKNKTPKPVQSIKSTEQITADSAVSFPVDI